MKILTGIAIAATLVAPGCVSVVKAPPMPTPCHNVGLVAVPDVPANHLVELTKGMDADHKLVTVLRAQDASIKILETALREQQKLIKAQQ